MTKWIERAWQLFMAWKLRRHLDNSLKVTAERQADFVRMSRILDMRESVRMELMAEKRRQNASRVTYLQGQWDLIEKILEGGADVRK